MPAVPTHVHRGWKGTPRLTRALSALGEERLFLVGDAAGYVEPFTGEGMGWALWGALALGPLADAGVARWDPALVDRWNVQHRRQVQQGQLLCKVVALGLRRPWMARAALRVFGSLPALAGPLVTRTSAAPDLRTGSPM